MEAGMYDIKVYEGNEERETIRGLYEHQALGISTVLKRHNIKFLVKKVTEREEVKSIG